MSEFDDNEGRARLAAPKPMTFEEMEFRAERLFREMVSELKQMRDRQGLSQRQLGVLSGVSQSFIAEMERGSATPSWTSLSKLCYALNTTMPALMIEVVFKGKEREFGDRARLSELASLAEEVIGLPDGKKSQTEAEETRRQRRHH